MTSSLPAATEAACRHAPILGGLSAALAVAACGGPADHSPPATARQGYYRCLYEGRHPFPTLDFVIGPGDSFTTFNTERGLFRPGTYTYANGELVLALPSEVRRFRAEANQGDGGGPFREVVNSGQRGPFLCSWAAADGPPLESLARAGERDAVRKQAGISWDWLFDTADLLAAAYLVLAPTRWDRLPLACGSRSSVWPCRPWPGCSCPACRCRSTCS